MALPTSASWCNHKVFKQTQGVAVLVAAGDATVLAAPGTGKSIRLQKLILVINSGSQNSVIKVEDGVGGTILLERHITANDTFCISALDFGDQGLKLSENTLLNLTVETASSDARAIAIGYIQQ